MRIQDEEIRNLFQKAEIQVQPDKKKVAETYESLQCIQQSDGNEFSIWNLLQRQFKFMDKTYIITYSLMIIISFCTVTVLKYTGVKKNAALAIGMILSEIMSTTAVLGINKLFFGKMAELGATCYFDTRICVSAGLLFTGIINFLVAILLAICSANIWKMPVLQTGVYILTSCFVSNLINMKILFCQTGKVASVVMLSVTLFSAIGYIILVNIPEALLMSTIVIWIAVCMIAVILIWLQIKRLLNPNKEIPCFS